jgi:hypothetical protein
VRNHLGTPEYVAAFRRFNGFQCKRFLGGGSRRGLPGGNLGWPALSSSASDRSTTRQSAQSESMQQRPRLGVRAKRQAEIRIARTPLCPGSEKRTLRVILASNPELELMNQIRQQSWRLMRDVPSSGCSPRTVAPSKGGSIPRPVSLGLALSRPHCPQASASRRNPLCD